MGDRGGARHGGSTAATGFFVAGTTGARQVHANRGDGPGAPERTHSKADPKGLSDLEWNGLALACETGISPALALEGDWPPSLLVAGFVLIL